MNELKTLTNENLRILVGQTEKTLTELRAELEKRDAMAQEREILNLDQHMKDAELNLRSIQDFLRYLIDEAQSSRSK
ncbi:hypothetical protein [Granulosicoccus antarcticus]|uniref:Uncharacterized protein n=1 Tax=Granulosicoccus antarcticus IMCC3135 TaxID=1192854 RepID=A0A2Z2NIF8_9GAMM|nr:hypothetical protein [Granulosicoccus antarcticus]ASJ70929.1 hypothetical protein IMCC3135_04080 [Granulosicoccus antarcticus IMCC3135]